MSASFKKYLLLLSFFCLGCMTVVSSYGQAFQWAIGTKGTSNIQTADIATDQSGNIYITGEYNGTIILGTDTLSSFQHWSNGPEMFVAKIDPQGTPLWLRRGAGPGLADFSQGESITVDAFGNAYVTGYYRNKVGFGNDTLMSIAANSNVYVAKIDPAGNWLWATSAGADNLSAGADISVTANGTIYVGGYFFNYTAFGADTLNSLGSSDLFVASFDNNGNYQWSRAAGGSGMDVITGIDADDQDNLYLTGTFDTLCVVETVGLNPVDERDLFVARYDATGALQWANGFGGTDDDESGGVATDAWGNVYLAGRFKSTIDFGGTTLVSGGADDVFLTKIDSTGAVLWAHQEGGPQFAAATDVAVGPQGTPHITGFFANDIVVGLDTLYNTLTNGSTDLFVARYDTAGVPLWARNGGGASSDDGEAIAIDNLGAAVVTGRLPDDAIFGSHVVLTNNTTKIYVTKINDWLHTTTVSGLVPCSNPPIVVDFTANGIFTAGNQFIAQLSDQQGSFVNAVSIGSTPGTTSGSVTCNIPPLTPNGWYKIRVVATSAPTVGSPIDAPVYINLGPPSSNVLPADTVYYCAGDSVFINSTPEYGVTYQWWKDGAVLSGANQPGIYAQSAGEFYFNASNACGVTNSDTIVVVESTAPDSTVTVSGPLNFCAGDSLLLHAVNNPDASFAWFQDSILFGPNASSIAVYDAGSYYVEVSNACGMKSSTLVTTSVTPLPDADISATGPTTFCSGNSVQLLSSNSAGLNVQWLLNGNAIAGATDSNYVSSAAGIYSVEVSNSCGTAVSDSIEVIVEAFPIADVMTQDSLIICQDDTVLLEGLQVAGQNFEWFFNGNSIPGANDTFFAASSTGDYQFAVYNGCGGDTSVIISVTVDTTCTVGVPTLSVLSYQLFPNPASAQLHLNFDESVDGSVLLLDVQGKVIAQEQVSRMTHVFNVDQFAAGAYSVVILSRHNKVLASQLILIE